MKDGGSLKFFGEESSMRNKLYLGFLIVVATIVAANLLVGLFVAKLALARFLSAVIGLGAGMLLGSFVANHILKNIENLAAATKTIGGGDLTKEVSITTKDEIGELADSFNQMVFSLRDMIAQFRKSSDDIIEASKTLSSFAEKTNATTADVAKISQQISKGAETQSRLLENTFAVMKRMADSIQIVADKAEIAAGGARRVGETAKRGKESMENSREELERVFTRIEATAALNRAFSDKIGKITKFADIITGVSEQTNLLSFNAAIEATRAGELGKGFSVVADEIRRLAEKSKGFAEEITTLIDEIRKDNSRILASLDEQTQGVRTGRKAVETSIGGLVDIMEKILDMVDDAQEISSITQRQKNDAQSVTQNMANVSKLSEDHVSSTEETARIAAAQVESMNEIVSSTQNLSNVADRLKNVASRFKVD